MARPLPHHVTLRAIFARGLEQASGALNELVKPALEFNILELQSLSQPTCVPWLSRIVDTQVAAVQLTWHGTTTGTCSLAFPARQVLQFVGACTGQTLLGRQLDAMHSAVFSEIGTLVLANLLQTMQHLIKQSFTCTLPGSTSGSLAQVLAPKPGGDGSIAVLAKLGCTIAQQSVEGYLILFCHSTFYEALVTASQTYCPEVRDKLCL